MNILYAIDAIYAYACLKSKASYQNPTPSINAQLPEEQSYQILSRSILKWRSRLFKEGPQQEPKQQQDELQLGLGRLCENPIVR